jgi:hypothetical protein
MQPRGISLSTLLPPLPLLPQDIALLGMSNTKELRDLLLPIIGSTGAEEVSQPPHKPLVRCIPLISPYFG